jgi:hypothetical protein
MRRSRRANAASERTVVLHVGLMKSGTTFVQTALFDNKPALAEQGVLVPGKGWGQQAGAVKHLLASDGEVGQRWDRLAAEIASGPPRSVISMEFLGPARPSVRRRAVRSLRPARVEVVCTVRDLNRSLAAMWQETLQNGRWWTWADYLAGAEQARPELGREPDSLAGKTFWRQQDAVRVCRAWLQQADQVTLVTLPHPGASPRELLERFAEAAGLDATPLALAQPANESLGAASALTLRALNEALAERGLEFPAGQILRKRVIAKQILASRRSVEPRIGLPVTPWVTEASLAMRERLGALPVRLVGSWDDLDPVPVEGVDPADVPAEEVAQAAIAALTGIVERRVRR